MTKYDPLTSVKTQVLLINGGRVRLNTGPLALTPARLAAAELCPMFHTELLIILSERNLKLTFYAKFSVLSHSENRRQQSPQGS